MTTRAIGQAALLLSLALLPAVGQAVYFRSKVSWQSPDLASETVTVERARSWGPTAMFVDARPDNEFAADHIPGAMLLNEDRWNELLQEFLAEWTPDRKVVVYCSTKSCNLARDVARRLRQEGQLPEVYVLEGGWEDWRKKNR